MYRGVNTGASSAHDFASAVACLAECKLTPTGRRRSEGTYGYPLNRKQDNNCNAKIRELSDGSIAFRLYSTDVVTWHPDDTVTASNWGSMTTSGFASQFLPEGLSFNLDGSIDYATQKQPGTTGGSWDSGAWSEYWGAVRVCHGKHSEVTFHRAWAGGHFIPDEDQLQSFDIPVLDRKIACAAAREHNLADFKPWLQLVTHHTELQHEGADLEACAAALKDRRFKDAAVRLPTIAVPRGFGLADRMKPLRFKGVRWDDFVTMSSLQRVRDYIYAQAGAYSTEQVTTVSRSQLSRTRVRTNALEKAGVYL